jgi:hypothetical protein
MKPLTIINGKFIRDGVEEKLEFGNREQIKAMQEHAAQLELLNKGKLPFEYDVETKYTLSGDFKCICGTKIFIEVEDDDEDDVVSEVVGMTESCHKCKKKYIIEKDDDDELVVGFHK